MYLAKVNYKREDVTHILSSILKNIISDNTVIICIGTDRAIGDALGPLVGTMLKNSDFKYPVYGTLDNPIHALNIYESIEKIKSKHSSSQFLAIDACLGSASNIGNIQIREGPILPGKGVGKKLPQVGTYSIVGIVDKIDENILQKQVIRTTTSKFLYIIRNLSFTYLFNILYVNTLTSESTDRFCLHPEFCFRRAFLSTYIYGDETVKANGKR